MSELTLYGADYSVYTRIVRLVLAEKTLTHRFVELDVFAAGGPPLALRARQPFGRIPVLEDGDFRLYETAAICRYLDEGFAGPSLQPAEPRGRARMAQIVGLLDSYAYRTLVWDIFVERMDAPREGRAPDEARIAAALPKARLCLGALQDLMAPGPWLAGPALSLADLHAAPMLAYFRLTPEGAALLAEHPALAAWWERMNTRPPMTATRFGLE